MNDKTGKILVSVSAVLGAGVIAGVVTYTVPEPETEKVYLPGPTVTETVHKPMKVEIPGPTVTKKVEVTKTVRPKIPDSVSRSNERKTPKKSKAPVASSGSAREIARSIFGSGFGCVAEIIQRESGWSVTATNPSSGAYGLPQALPAEKLASAGADWRTSARTQLIWMKQYLNQRYGGACAGWEFWKSHNYY